jgi:predicted XRE-type DNA-binding protein
MKTEPKRRNAGDTSITRGGKNVFEDLGFAKDEAAELKVKSELTLRIRQRINNLGLTQVKAAAQLGVSQPDVSKLLRGRHTGFSVERLLMLLTALNVDIDIVVRPRLHRGQRHGGTVRVSESSAA